MPKHPKQKAPRPLRIGSLFSGYGGLELGIQEVLDAQTVWHSEIEPNAVKVLAHHHPDIPNLGDITKVKWRKVPEVDILCGGFPCQDVSVAGRRAGIDDGTRSGLWTVFAKAIKKLTPRLVVIENVRGLLSARAHVRALGDINPDLETGRTPTAIEAVLADLADLGYDARWTCLAASDAGAPHQRQRVVIAAAPAHANGEFHLRPKPAALARTRAALSGAGEAHPAGAPVGASAGPGLWPGPYGLALDRWSTRLDRPAPGPLDYTPKGDRLSIDLIEWMMGLPKGHITSVPGLSRNAQTHLLGNGVVPAQITLALADLLDDDLWHLDTADGDTP